MYTKHSTTSHMFSPPPTPVHHSNAYDGRGNAVARTADELQGAVDALGGFPQGLYVEKWVPFVCEMAVMVARSSNGEIVSFPVVQTIHRDNICHTTETPARVPLSVQQQAKRVAESAVACFQGRYCFAVVFVSLYIYIVLGHCASTTYGCMQHMLLYTATPPVPLAHTLPSSSQLPPQALACLVSRCFCSRTTPSCSMKLHPDHTTAAITPLKPPAPVSTSSTCGPSWGCHWATQT